MDATRATVSAYREQFKLGQRTLLDLLDTENEHFSSTRQYIEAKYDYYESQYRILNSMGVLLYALDLAPPPEASSCMIATRPVGKLVVNETEARSK